MLPGERLTWPRTIGLGAQHVVAMFGATFLVPVLTGFPPSTTLLFSGVGTVLFLLVTRNRLPSYLGSSFAFIVPIVAATKAHGMPITSRTPVDTLCRWTLLTKVQKNPARRATGGLPSRTAWRSAAKSAMLA